MQYQERSLSLTDAQKQKLIRGKQNGEAVTIQIKQDQIGGDDVLYLTRRQLNKLNNINNSARITLSKTQLKSQTGGFLSAIIPFLPTIGKVLGSLALSGAAGAISGATNQAVKKKMSGDGISLHIPSNELKLMIESADQLEQVKVFPRGTTAMIKGEISEQKGGFIGTLLASLAGILLPSLLGGKGLSRAGEKKSL
jgi:hypothetical protein